MIFRNLILFIFILSSLNCLGQDIQEEYVLIFVHPKALKKSVENGKKIKDKDIYAVLPGKKIELRSSTLRLEHRGILDSIGVDYLVVDGLRYNESDISNVFLVEGHFAGAKILNVLLKSASVMYGIAGIGVLMFDSGGTGFIVLGLATSLWILSNRLGGVGSSTKSIFDERQFRISKLELDPTSLPKDY